MRIGWYVHHHGAGHRKRAEAIVSACRAGEVILLGTGLIPGRATIDLPDDRLAAGFDGLDGAEATPDWLHFAPLHHRGVQQRNALIAGWIAAAQPDLMVVDVSVEVAALARACGVPVVYVRLAGCRRDAPHQMVFRYARALIAPFPAELESPDTPSAIQRKTFYAGFVGAKAAGTAPPEHRDRPLVVVVAGRGGTGLSGAAVADAAAATAGHDWVVLGSVEAASVSPGNLRFMGWVEDVPAWLARADVVIGGGGDGVVAAVAAAGRPFICVPEDRPFDEQFSTASRLGAIGAAIHLDGWPVGAAWPELLRAARRMGGARLHALHRPDAAAETIRFLRRQAAF